MRRTFRRVLADDNGSVSLEFGLVCSAFVFLILFTFEGGMLLWAKGAMQSVATQTARCRAVGSPDCTDSNIGAYVSGLIDTWGVSGVIPSSSLTIDAPLGVTCGRTAGTYSSVTITSPGSNFVWLMSPLSGLALTASACHPSGI